MENETPSTKEDVRYALIVSSFCRKTERGQNGTHSDGRDELHGDTAVAVGVTRGRRRRDIHEAVAWGASGGSGDRGRRRVGGVVEAAEEASQDYLYPSTCQQYLNIYS